MKKLTTSAYVILSFLFLLISGNTNISAYSADGVTSQFDNEYFENRTEVRPVITASNPDVPLTIDGSRVPGYWDPDRNWWHLFKKGKLAMKDTTVEYPGFIKFCVDVYNWADKTFNSYDPEYVVGTGKRWKARIISDNWTDYYSMRFDDKMSMRMMNDVTSNLGPSLQYMAVSIGYSLNLNHAIFGTPINNKRWDFGFNCARFNLDLYYIKNTGGTQLRQFDSYRGKKFFKSYFPGVNLCNFGFDIYYFFNNRKYSQGAAYNFSKIQKRNAGSFILGFSYANQDISMDFSTLDKDLLKYYTLDSYFYKFHYNNYCILLGYGYNVVCNPHLLFNVTLMPAFGFNHCYEDSAEGNATLLSINTKGKISLTYNLKNFFAGICCKADGHLYSSDRYNLFNAIFTASASAGIRF